MDLVLIAPSWLKPAGPRGAPPSGAAEIRAILEDEEGLGRGLRCRACGHVITGAAARTQIAGAHEHERMNPAGFVYLIGCFRIAPGCVTVGEPSPHFTWFQGNVWRVALCGSCFVHLGWKFTAIAGGDISFFGLILDRLAPDEHPS